MIRQQIASVRVKNYKNNMQQNFAVLHTVFDLPEGEGNGDIPLAQVIPITAKEIISPEGMLRFVSISGTAKK